MKRTVTLILALALLLACLTGCESKKDLPMTTIVTETGEQKELPLATVLIDTGIEPSNFRTFLKTVPGFDREFHMEVQAMPQEPERSQRLQRIRTEILAGKGPDLFISDCYRTTVVDIREAGVDLGDGPLFHFPSQAMENRMFLPLDGYIENAQFMEFDKLHPAVMAVGRNQEGQQIIPLKFDFYLTGYIPSVYDMPEERPKSRQEMLDSGCPVLEFAAKGMWGDALLDSFAQTIDQENDLPAFTEEELLERALALWDSRQKRWSGEYDFFGVDKWDGCGPASMFFIDYSPREDTILVPDYNNAGGVSAFVTVFAAINRNANYPGYAFRVLDKLLSKSEQEKQALYGEVWMPGLPVCVDFDKDAAFLGGNRLAPEDLEEYQELLEMIDNVRFLTSLDQELIRTLVPVCAAEHSTQADVEKTAHQVYTTMKMMLAES